MDRYHRQRLLIGDDGQRRLGEASVLVVGCGALGCVSADLLARAGVGRLTLVDRDLVELTNLQRQTLFTEADVGTPKSESARRRLETVNSEIRIDALVEDLTPANVERIAACGRTDQVDVMIDATDNFETRYVLNDVSVKHGVPLVYAGAVATTAMLMVIAQGAPCLRCVFEQPPAPGTQPTCDTAGVLAGATAMIASRQAVEAIKLITRGPVERGLVEMDVWDGRMRRIKTGEPRPDCPCCAKHNFEFLEGERQGDAATLCGRNAVQIGAPARDAPLDLEALGVRLNAHGDFTTNRLMLRGTLSERAPDGSMLSLTVFHDGRAIIDGTSEPRLARGVYARYVGG